MRSRLVFLLALLGAAAPVAAVTISIDLERLKDAGGNPMPVSGLVVLTAAVSGTFTGPTATSFAGGDELVLAKWDLSAFNMPGLIQEDVGGLNLSGSWGVNDPLRVYWYPSLTLASNAPGAGTAYGRYSDLVGIDGSDPWKTPTNSEAIALKFFTSDATFLNAGGSNPSTAGLASFQVVPEPNVLGLAITALAAAGFFRLRRPAGLAG